MAAGFDGVELHFAHAYTMASFLSARNTREDGYGGSREGRIRLALEVLSAVRERVGRRATVGCRMLGDEVIEGGTRIDDAAWFAARFAEAGMDFVSVSKGGKFEDARQPKVGAAAYPYTGESGHECMPTVRIDAPGPFGRNLPLSRAIREAVHAVAPAVPVGCGGSGPSTKRRTRSPAATATSSPLRDSPSPTPTGSGRSSSAAATTCAAASTRTTARGSTRSTRRSPASSGIAARSMTRSSPRRASAVRPPTTGRGGSSRRRPLSPEPRSGRAAAEHGGNHRGLVPPWTERDPPDARGAGSDVLQRGRRPTGAHSSVEQRSALGTPPRDDHSIASV